MKVRLDWDEWYPVYEVRLGDNHWGETREIPDELVEQSRRVMAEFKAVQEELARYRKPDAS